MTPETIALLCILAILPVAVWYLKNEQLKGEKRLYDARIKELTGSVQPVNEILLTYGRLNTSLEEMLDKQLSMNTSTTAAMIQVAKQVAMCKNPQSVQVPAAHPWTMPGAAREELDDSEAHLIGAGEIQN